MGRNGAVAEQRLSVVVAPEQQVLEEVRRRLPATVASRRPRTLRLTTGMLMTGGLHLGVGSSKLETSKSLASRGSIWFSAVGCGEEGMGRRPGFFGLEGRFALLSALSALPTSSRVIGPAGDRAMPDGLGDPVPGAMIRLPTGHRPVRAHDRPRSASPASLTRCAACSGSRATLHPVEPGQVASPRAHHHRRRGRRAAPPTRARRSSPRAPQRYSEVSSWWQSRIMCSPPPAVPFGGERHHQL